MLHRVKYNQDYKLMLKLKSIHQYKLYIHFDYIFNKKMHKLDMYFLINKIQMNNLSKQLVNQQHRLDNLLDIVHRLSYQYLIDIKYNQDCIDYIWLNQNMINNLLNNLACMSHYSNNTRNNKFYMLIMQLNLDKIDNYLNMICMYYLLKIDKNNKINIQLNYKFYMIQNKHNIYLRINKIQAYMKDIFKD